MGPDSDSGFSYLPIVRVLLDDVDQIEKALKKKAFDDFWNLIIDGAIKVNHERTQEELGPRRAARKKEKEDLFNLFNARQNKEIHQILSGGSSNQDAAADVDFLDITEEAEDGRMSDSGSTENHDTEQQHTEIISEIEVVGTDNQPIQEITIPTTLQLLQSTSFSGRVTRSFLPRTVGSGTDPSVQGGQTVEDKMDDTKIYTADKGVQVPDAAESTSDYEIFQISTWQHVLGKIEIPFDGSNRKLMVKQRLVHVFECPDCFEEFQDVTLALNHFCNTTHTD